MKNIVLLSVLIAVCLSECVHDDFIKNTTLYQYDDTAQSRLLQQQNIGPLRIFVDYTQLDTTDHLRSLAVKRIMNITSNYFYNLMKVKRLNKLYYPSEAPLTCNSLTIPSKYITLGVEADIGIVVGTQINASAIYLAKSTSCAIQKSDKRPIWGIILFNIIKVRNDRQGFQEQVYIALHQITHILAFSSLHYINFPAGNPIVGDVFNDDQILLSSPKINAEVQAHFGCKGQGLQLEDQDSSLLSSHWEFHSIATEYMTAHSRKQSIMSRFTLALFDSTGWYFNVDYSYADPTVWGKNKGCGFKDVDNCQFQEFCTGNGFDSDWDYTATGRCEIHETSGTCKINVYYGNTICTDENFQQKNVNAKLYASERGDYNSRSIRSSYRQSGLTPTPLNQRCYLSVCNFQGTIVYILVDVYVFICSTPGLILPALPSFEGTLQCPSSFPRMCNQKKTCYNQCSRNGICVNGLCLCYGSLTFSFYCDDIPALNEDNSELLNLQTGGRTLFEVKKNSQKKSLRSYDMDEQCLKGFTFDPITQTCESCQELLGCPHCDKNGCLECDNGQQPENGTCASS